MREDRLLRSKSKRRPVFHKYGSYYHLRISSAEDLEYILTLADGRWMATSCPMFGLNMDPAFLRFLDADGNNRIISQEVREAIRWLLKRLRPSETWIAGQLSLPLQIINTDNPEGKALGEVARLVLKNLNLPEAVEISLEQVRNRQKIMAQANYNGDGVIPPEVVKDPEAAQFTRDLVASYGGVPDASGLKGVDEALLNQFKKEANAYLQWYDQGVIPDDEGETAIMPFGASTPKMFQAVAAVRDKVDQFFAQCALVRFDPRMAEKMDFREDELLMLDYKDRQAIMEHLRLAPLARPNPAGILPLDESINESYIGLINALRDQVVLPMFGETGAAITEAQWRQILTKFAPYEAWFKAKPSTSIEPLGVDKLSAYLNSPHDPAIRELIIEDKAVADEIQQLQNLEKLLLYHQWLFEFVNNYISFPHLFDPETTAIFEKGKLVLGGREFNFSIRVENRAAHAALSKNSGVYLLYLQVTGVKPEDALEIAVPVTRGSAKDFYVGKRGVFFTPIGRELDAQIVQIVENPISLLESIKEPFRRVSAMISGRVAQISATIQKESEKTITAAPGDQQIIQKEMQNTQQSVSQPGAVATAAPPPIPAQSSRPENQRNSGTARDLMIGTGLLIAGLGTALKFMVDAAKQMTQPRTLQVLVIMIGVFLTIAILASVVSALRKLRQRDLGVLLQASGWAINGRMRLIRPMARLFCRKTRIPKGAKKKHKELLVHLERLSRKKQKKDSLP